MNKVTVFLVLALVSVLSVSASPKNWTADCATDGYDWANEDPVGSIDAECQRYGFDFGIAKFNIGGSNEINEDFDVSFEGDDSSVDWTSDPAAAGVLQKAGQCYKQYGGGTSGTVDQLTHGISHVTLCGNGPYCGDGQVNGDEECDGNLDLLCSEHSNVFVAGSVECTSSCNYDFSKCKTYEDPCEDGNCNGVPEFSVFTLGLAVLGAGLGLAFIRRD